VLLLGDSIAETLALELGASAASHGVSLVGAVRPGCGVITGTPLEVDGTVVPWGAGCADSTAPYEEQAVASAHARVIVVLSSWEDSDRLVDGHAVSFDTPTGDQVWFQLLDGMRARLDAGGATIVLVEMPPPATFSDAGPADPDQLRRMVALGSLYRSYVAARPGVELVDLASIVCPGGPPCPEYVDGVRLRPTDGIHFQQDGAAWVAPRLYDALARGLDPVAKQLGPP